MKQVQSCDELTGRMRDICMGKADLPIDTINKYRQQWGLEPLSIVYPVTGTMHLKRKAVEQQDDLTLGRYPGTNLAIMLRKCGIPVNIGCGCEEWITKMNAWGVEGCYKNRQEIVDRLKEQASKLTTSQIVWTGIMLMWHGVRPTIGELVDEAIWSAANVIANEK